MPELQINQLLQILGEIRDNQRVMLELQEESMAMRKEEFNMAKAHFERAEKIQTRAEQLQGKSGGLIVSMHKFMKVFLPIAGVLLIYLSWLIFFRN